MSNIEEGVAFNQANLKLGFDEMQWMQGKMARMREMAMRARISENRSTGNLGFEGLFLVHEDGGELDTVWELHDDDADGTVNLRSRNVNSQNADLAYAVTETGDIVEYNQDDANPNTVPELALTNDGTWRTIEIAFELSNYAPGRIALTGASAALGGADGADFTRFSGFTSDPGIGRGTKIRILAADSSNGNEGDYEIDTVTDANTATLTGNALGTTESDLPFLIIGDYFGSTPASPYLHQRLVPVLYEVTRTRTPSAAGRIIIADAKRSGAAVTIIDRRWASRVREVLTRTPVRIFPATNMVGSDLDDLVAKMYNSAFTAPTTHYIWPALAPCREAGVEGNLLMVCKDTSGTKFREFDHRTYTWQNPGGGAAVTLIDSSDGNNLAITDMPAGSGYTHVYFHININVVNMRTTGDNGQTWSGKIAIWDAPAVDAADQLIAVACEMTRDHRLIVAGTYYDDSAGTYNIKYIYSDDYGTTWSTNTNFGTDLVNDGGGGVAYVVDDIAEAADGTIWTSWRTDGDGVGLCKGVTPNIPTATGGASGGGTIVSTAGSESRLFMAPNGAVTLFWGEDWAGVSAILHAAQIQAKSSAINVLRKYPLLVYNDTNNTVNTFAVKQSSDGALHLVFDEEVSTSMYHLELLVTEMPQYRVY